MADRSMIIIGAGIAGLAVGCYAQMNGYRTRIFEMHSIPGGMCTSWRRRGYVFDGCIHWLPGTAPDSAFYHVWEELGAVQGRQFVYHDEFRRFEAPDGRSFTVYTDIDRLAGHMKELSPADTALIDEYAAGARAYTRFELFQLLMDFRRPGEVLGLAGRARQVAQALPRMGPLARWGRVSMQAFAARFRDPFLRQVFPLIHEHPPLPMMVHLASMAGYHARSGGWPIGGSLEFMRAITRRYAELGGELHCQARVDKIRVEGDRAVGVCLADGTEHRAGMVVSAADGRTTIFHMLDGRYTNEAIQTYYAQPSGSSGVQVSLGVARDLSSEPHHLVLLLDPPLQVGGRALERLTVRHFCFDPTLAPAGKSVVKVEFESDHAYWYPLREQGEAYEVEKQHVAQAVIGLLEKRFPGLAAQVEVVDVATPFTWERYTGNWHGLGAWFPARLTPGNMLGGLSRTLPGLEQFYMAGQWAEASGGLPTGAASGRNLIELLCKRDGQPFVTVNGRA